MAASCVSPPRHRTASPSPKREKADFAVAVRITACGVRAVISVGQSLLLYSALCNNFAGTMSPFPVDFLLLASLTINVRWTL
jgi:hypothetical protein